MLALHFASLAAFFGAVLAQTSLHIPGFDPQPISADILGVDGEGRTTWALHQGALTGTFSEPSFPGTATLVEGPTDISFTYAPPGAEFTMGNECALSSGLAICSGTVEGQALTVTGTIDAIAVQVGTTATPVTSPTPSSDISPPPTATPPSSLSSPSKTTSTPGPSETKTSNGKMTLPSVSGILISAVTFALIAQL